MPSLPKYADDENLRCEYCSQRLFEGDTIEELWTKYKNEKKLGAFLELVYRAFNNLENKEEAWQKIYSPLFGHIKTYLSGNSCKKMTWLIYNNIRDDEGIAHEVFIRKLLSYGKDKKKSRDRTKINNIFEPKSYKSLIKFINQCTLHTVIELFRTHQPNTKDIEELSKQAKTKKHYSRCLKQFIELFNDPSKYSEMLDRRYIGKKGKAIRLARVKEYYLILKLSICDEISPRKILSQLNEHKFKNKYQIGDGSSKKIMKKIYDLKEDALIDLFLTIVHSEKRNGCEHLRQYFLTVLFPRQESLDELRDDAISRDEKSEED